MIALHDPLPPDVFCTLEDAEEFDAWLETHNARLRSGYEARPCTHMLIAWLESRRALEEERRRVLTEESARAVALFNSFSEA